MQMLHLPVSDELAAQLAPYREQLPTWLELNLRLWQMWSPANPLHLPAALHERLQALLDKQDTGGVLTSSERQEAEALVDLAEWLSLLYLRATHHAAAA